MNNIMNGIVDAIVVNTLQGAVAGTLACHCVSKR